jgi:hypothetical protein
MACVRSKDLTPQINPDGCRNGCLTIREVHFYWGMVYTIVWVKKKRHEVLSYLFTGILEVHFVQKEFAEGKKDKKKNSFISLLSD